MEGRKFDDLTRSLAASTTRRQTITRIGAGVVVFAATALGRTGAEAATCREPGALCRGNGDCCNGNCGSKNYFGRRTCQCNNNGGEYCDGKCCGTTGMCINGDCVYPSALTQPTDIEMAWHAILYSDALAPVVSVLGFQPLVGHRFQIQTGRKPATTSLVEAEIVELDLPHRAVFRWRASEMAEPVTAQMTVTQSETGLVFGIKRVDGDPATCDLATKLLGRNWQHRAFQKQLPQAMGRVTPE